MCDDQIQKFKMIYVENNSLYSSQIPFILYIQTWCVTVGRKNNVGVV